ncbi:hypothetical protein Q1695_010941 [Nippostrongylus brasiliensis]|nr:hypothetical protein Q1695_010941 [Nippostrongylus brasiliensis]
MIPLLRSLRITFAPVDIVALSSRSVHGITQKTRSKTTEVCTTGYSFLTAGGRMAKYGVFWGENDPRNVVCEVPGLTNVAAMIMSMIEAVRGARKRGVSNKLIVYTDFNCPPEFQAKLASYAARDFHTIQGTKMKNAELLKELYEISKDVNVEFRHRPAVQENQQNSVMAKILEGHAFKTRAAPSTHDVFANVNTSEEILADGSTPSTSTSAWPHVYTRALFRSSKKGFKSASYATVWSDKRHGADSMHRLAMFPVTLFRAQLAAIEEALKEAVDNRLPQVVVVTDSSSFLTTWRKKWVKSDGSTVPNKFMYNRIWDLTQSGTEVCFRYEEPRKDSDVWSHALDRCLEAIDSPLMGKDRSEYGRSLADVVSDPSQLKDSGIQRVRIFKRGTDFASGYVWEKVDDEQSRCGAEGGDKALQALVKVLEQASLWGLTHLIVRTDSSRLILAAENWLPIWHRNGWRNSLHKPIADCESWQRIWSLKKSIKVYWEFMEPTDDDDKAASQLIPVRTSVAHSE